MTMRQHYKAQALAGGLITYIGASDSFTKLQGEGITDVITQCAGDIADAMIEDDLKHIREHRADPDKP